MNHHHQRHGAGIRRAWRHVKAIARSGGSNSHGAVAPSLLRAVPCTVRASTSGGRCSGGDGFGVLVLTMGRWRGRCGMRWMCGRCMRRMRWCCVVKLVLRGVGVRGGQISWGGEASCCGAGERRRSNIAQQRTKARQARVLGGWGVGGHFRHQSTSMT